MGRTAIKKKAMDWRQELALSIHKQFYRGFGVEIQGFETNVGRLNKLDTIADLVSHRVRSTRKRRFKDCRKDGY